MFYVKLLRRLAAPRIRRMTAAHTLGGPYRRVYHYHVRKSAGTSLNAAFWGLAGLDLRTMGYRSRVCRNGLVFVRHDPELIEEGRYFFANAHLPAYSLRLPEDTFTVTILRDPLKRVLSHYRYLLWAREHPRDRNREPYIKWLKEEVAWLGNSFGDFIDRVPRQHLLQQLSMFSEDYDVSEAAERILACSAVCFTESYTQDLHRISQQLQLPLVEKYERRFVQEISTSPEERNRAREALADEFSLLETVKRQRAASVG